MLRRGFTFFEAILAIALIGVIGFFGYSYLNVSTLSMVQSKSQLQAHITLLQSMVLECKTLSESMPKQIGGTDATATPVDALECQTTPTYPIDGGRGVGIPKSPTGFDPYTATESGGSFWITLSAAEATPYADVLAQLKQEYTASQAQLRNESGKTFLDIYLLR